MKKQRKHYTPEEKVAILRRHLLDKEPISKLCDAGFEEPLAAHQHWHIDVSYINIGGTFYYLCSVLDGCTSNITTTSA